MNYGIIFFFACLYSIKIGIKLLEKLDNYNSYLLIEIKFLKNMYEEQYYIYNKRSWLYISSHMAW